MPSKEALIQQLGDELEQIRRAVDHMARAEGQRSAAVSDDVYQQVVQQLLQIAKNGEGPDRGTWLPLAKTIAKRRLIDRIRAKDRGRDAKEQLRYRPEFSDPETRATDQLLSRALDQALSNLPGESQAVLRLRFLAGLKLRQIADVRGTNIQRAYSEIQSALKLLRSELKDLAAHDEALADILDEQWPEQ